MTDLAIIILSFNTKDLTLKCLDSIYSKKWQVDFEVWIVDNGSTDGSVEQIKKKYKEVNIIENPLNLGFTAGNNVGLKKAKAKTYLLLNSDTEVLDDSLDNLYNFAQNNNFGIISAKLLNKDKTLQPNAGNLPFGISLFVWISGLDDFLPIFKKLLPSYHRKYKEYYSENKEADWVGGTAMLIKAEVLEKIGFLDENIFMYGEDVEYCIRAWKEGIKVGFTKDSQVVHLGGGSSKDPEYKQWLGEYKGLIYIYRKYSNFLGLVYLKTLIYLFTILRILAFLIIGRKEASFTYAKILTSL